MKNQQQGYLTRQLGEYLSTHEITTLTRLSSNTLDKWRKRGLLRSERLNGRWYYSVSSVLDAIKSQKE